MVLGRDESRRNEKQQQESQSISDSERSSSRSVTRIVDSIQTLEGEGFLVHRAFPSRYIEDFDPFLVLDEFGPINLAPGEAKGAPNHPHRGFETVTYMLDGQFEHKDSQGNRGKLNPGDVQWMTAGAGVIHSEMQSNGCGTSIFIVSCMRKDGLLAYGVYDSVTNEHHICPLDTKTKKDSDSSKKQEEIAQ